MLCVCTSDCSTGRRLHSSWLESEDGDGHGRCLEREGDISPSQKGGRWGEEALESIHKLCQVLGQPELSRHKEQEEATGGLSSPSGDHSRDFSLSPDKWTPRTKINFSHTHTKVTTMDHPWCPAHNQLLPDLQKDRKMWPTVKRKRGQQNWSWDNPGVKISR